MATPPYDPRYNFPFFDQHHIPTVNPETTFPTSQVGDPSLSSTPNPAFFQTFGPCVPYNPILVLSLMGSMQQPQSIQQQPMQLSQPSTEHLAHSQPIHAQPTHSQPTYAQPTHFQPTHQATTNTQTQGQQTRTTVHNDLLTANKILLEPKDHT